MCTLLWFKDAGTTAGEISEDDIDLVADFEEDGETPRQAPASDNETQVPPSTEEEGIYCLPSLFFFSVLRLTPSLCFLFRLPLLWKAFCVPLHFLSLHGAPNFPFTPSIIRC